MPKVGAPIWHTSGYSRRYRREYTTARPMSEDRREHRDADQVEQPVDGRIEHQVREHGERDDERDRQPQVAADLRQHLGEVDFAEFGFERRGECQARKAALQLHGVRRLRRSSGGRCVGVSRGAAHAAIRQAGTRVPRPGLESFLVLAPVPGVLDASAPDFIGIPAGGSLDAGRGRRNGALAHMVGVGGRAGGDRRGRARSSTRCSYAFRTNRPAVRGSENGVHRSGPAPHEACAVLSLRSFSWRLTRLSPFGCTSDVPRPAANAPLCSSSCVDRCGQASKSSPRRPEPGSARREKSRGSPV